ncbi:MAG TPA: ATP-binding cassette domain-containing protein, partial [Candidatus Acidoferrum sp.]|nr:ATP-binding cassette domain-containing protein [Candidatus Acidoferrum sp.]
MVLICLAASISSALIVAWGVDLLGLLPFHILAPAIFINNALMGLLLAPPLLLFLYPRVKRWGLRYQDIVGRGTGGERLGEGQDQNSPPPAPHASVVHAHDVSFIYDGAARPALDRLSVTICPGESVALMGRSGAGKSTLCYALNGLVPRLLTGHWTGRLAVNGHDTRHRPVWQQAGSVGLVFQDFEAQLVSTSVERELAFPLEHLPPQPHARKTDERIVHTLERVGLAGLERRNPLSLSGGERQRLVMASTLIREPALVALDEPFTDLDPAGRRALAILLATLKASGTTLVIAGHDPEEAAAADRICILDHGRLVWDGRPRELFGRPEQADLARRFGIRPLPLATCFSGLGLSELPLTVEEAWAAADADGLRLEAHMCPSGTPVIGTPVIEVQRASYEYRHGAPVLSEVDLTIRDGEFVAIIGRNGSGKSTLASLLNGLKHPTTGRVLMNGQDTRGLSAGQLAARIRVVFQDPDHQIFAETVEEEVVFSVRNLGYSEHECAQRVAAALLAVGLDAPHLRTLDPFSLTKGER